MEATPFHSIIVEDLQHRILLWNEGARRNYGYSSEEVVGNRSEVLDAAEPELRDRLYEKALETGKAEERLTRRRKDGSTFVADVAVTRRDGPEGALGFVVVSKDITAQLRAEQQVLRESRRRIEVEDLLTREADQAKGRFVANLSHELRTPLNSIIGFSELLHGSPMQTEQKALVADVLYSARHLQKLIEDMLDLARTEAADIEFQPEEVDLAAIMRAVVADLQDAAAKKAIEVHVESMVLTPRVDLQRLHQVLYNLVDNAIKFTNSGGQIWMRANREGRRVRIEVEDTGIGIAAQDLPKLFVEFQQLDQSTTKNHQGTGLGLALVKRLVEAQDGIVGVHSQPGRGSVFYVLLPYEGEARTEEEHRILIASDDPEELKELQDALPQAGFVFEVASDENAAISLVLKMPFDAIVVGLGLGDQETQSLVSMLRYHGRRVPVIVLGDSEEWHYVGVVTYLQRPLKSDRVVSELKRWLSKS